MPITASHIINDYYQALLERNANYIDVFYVGVKTTLVFCISTCSAKKPKKENVDFFSSFKETLQYGYVPCKICNPIENTNKIPDQVQRAIQIVKENLKEKTTDHKLLQNNINPKAVRVWFKKHRHLTFHTFQRMWRINNAYKELEKSKKIIDAALGFNYTYKYLTEKKSSTNARQQVIFISRIHTPLGPMFVCATEEGVCLLEFTDRRMLETEFKDIQKRLGAKILVGKNKYIKQINKELDEYFLGKRKHFDVLLNMLGTEFQKLAWKSLQKIPYGSTTTYQKQAEKISKGDIKPTVSANGYNKISIIIPCHRVISENKELQGYGGGIERKKWLIEFEKGNSPLINKDFPSP